MKLFDKILDVYYDVTWRVTDLVDTVKYKTLGLVAKLKGHKDDSENIIEEEIVLPEKPRKKKTAKKKKK